MKKLIISALALSAVITSAVIYAQSADDPQQNSAISVMSAEKAQQLALSIVPGSVEEIELENDDNVQIYDISIKKSDGTLMEVELNAITGEVVEVEQERHHGGKFWGWGDDDDDRDGDRKHGRYDDDQDDDDRAKTDQATRQQS